jgi:hypothetical protein
MTATRLFPVVPFLKIPEEGEPYLEGQVCKRCAAIFLGARIACSRCGARDPMGARTLSNAGTLHTFSIVHRSLPGVEVPYVSAVVDLEGGGVVKGNLIGVEPNPRAITLGMPVSVVYKTVTVERDKERASCLAYFFEPRGRAQEDAS